MKTWVPPKRTITAYTMALILFECCSSVQQKKKKTIPHSFEESRREKCVVVHGVHTCVCVFLCFIRRCGLQRKWMGRKSTNAQLVFHWAIIKKCCWQAGGINVPTNNVFLELWPIHGVIIIEWHNSKNDNYLRAYSHYDHSGTTRNGKTGLHLIWTKIWVVIYSDSYVCTLVIIINILMSREQ